MADFKDVVAELKTNKKSQDDGFKRVEDAVLGGTKENKGAVDEGKKKEAAAKKKELTLFGEIASGIKAMNKTLMEGLAKLGKKGLSGLGMIAALVAGPFIMLAAFFKQIAMELAFLKNLSKGKVISKIFSPIKSFFAAIGRLGKTLGGSQFKSLLKINMKPFTMIAQIFTSMGKDIKPLGASVVKNVKAGIAAVSKFITPVVNFFKSIINAAKTSASFMTGFKPVMKFFATIGKTLGKFFLPVTFLMAAFDAVTGFMDGYDEGGILGGIEGAVTKVFNGLVSAPLDLLKSAVSWILGKLGFENAEKTLDSFSFKDFFTSIFQGIFDGIEMAVDFIKELFTFPEDGGLLGGIGKLIDILFLPINLAINFIKGMFGFTDEDGGKLPPFSIGKFLTDMVTKVIEYISGIFPSFDDLKDMLPSASGLLNSLSGGLFGTADDPELSSKRKEIRKLDQTIADLEANQIVPRLAELEKLDKFGGFSELKKSRMDELMPIMAKKDELFFQKEQIQRSLEKRAMGGPVKMSIPYLVGEKGPELFIPKSDGMIKNEQQTNQMMQSAVGKNGGGGTTTIIDNSVSAPSNTNNNSSTSTFSPLVQTDRVVSLATAAAM